MAQRGLLRLAIVAGLALPTLAPLRAASTQITQPILANEAEFQVYRDAVGRRVEEEIDDAKQQERDEETRRRSRIVEAPVAYVVDDIFWFVIFIPVLVCFLIVWASWEEIAAWFYGLKPHPTTSIVDRRRTMGRAEEEPAMNEIVRPGRVEVLAPQSVPSYPDVAHLPQGFLGMSIFARARYASEQRQIEAYRDLVSAKNALLRTLTEQYRIVVDHAVAREHALNLDQMREMARSQIRGEVRAGERREELTELGHQVDMARLKLELEQINRARENLSTAPKQKVAPPTTADSLRAVGEEIDEVSREFAVYRKGVVDDAGGEEYLTEEQRHHLNQFEIFRDRLIEGVMQKLL